MLLLSTVEVYNWSLKCLSREAFRDLSFEILEHFDLVDLVLLRTPLELLRMCAGFWWLLRVDWFWEARLSSILSFDLRQSPP